MRLLDLPLSLPLLILGMSHEASQLYMDRILSRPKFIRWTRTEYCTGVSHTS